MKLKTTFLKNLALVFALSPLVTNCARNLKDDGAENSDESSVSESVASAIGGALSSTSSGGTQAFFKLNSEAPLSQRLRSELNPLPAAFAAAFCPTFRTTSSACSASGNDMWLEYSDCSFIGRVVWNGVQRISVSAGSPACGTFPYPGANGSLYRQFASAVGATTAGTLALSLGRNTIYIDHASANLSNFDQAPIAAINPDGGYGVAVSFGANGLRNSVQFAHRTELPNVFNYSVVGSLSLSENSTESSRSVSGSITVYHNLLQVIGTSTLSQLAHADSCCHPTSGTIATTFSAGANVAPTTRGAELVGKTESLNFTGCGTATLTKADGSTANLTLRRCY